MKTKSHEEVYKQALDKIRSESKVKESKIGYEYASKTAIARVGDRLDLEYGSFIIEDARVSYANKYPEFVYIGTELTKKGLPRKDGRKLSVFNSNLKGWRMNHE